jgi:hypothetical protein
MPRAAFLALAVLALLAAALPAHAAPPAATPSCAQAALPFALADLATAPAPAAPAATTALPDWLAGARPAQTAVVYHGYCACECSRIKDCNTDADCSNHRCLGGISCC